MKITTLILLLCCSFCFGQIKCDTFIINPNCLKPVNFIEAFTPDSSVFSNICKSRSFDLTDTSIGYQIIYDTLPAIIIVVDTAEYETYQELNGLGVVYKIDRRSQIYHDARFIYGYVLNTVFGYHEYLDEKKEKLPDNFVTLMHVLRTNKRKI